MPEPDDTAAAAAAASATAAAAATDTAAPEHPQHAREPEADAPPSEHVSRSDTWGASAAIFAAGSLLWPLLFFFTFMTRAGMRAPENEWRPHYSGAWQETVDAVAISGSYVGWVAPSLLAILAGLGFLVTPTSDEDSQSMLRPLPFVAALIGGFMLAWTVLGVVVLSTDQATADSEDGRQLWGMVFLTPVSIVLALVLGRLDFRPLSKRIELLRAAVTKAQRELDALANPARFYGDVAVTAHAQRSAWKRPLLVQAIFSLGIFVFFLTLHREPFVTSLLAAGYVTALGALVFLMMSLIQRSLIDARVAKLCGHPRQGLVETVGAWVLVTAVTVLMCATLWFVFSGITPIIVPVLYCLAFLAAMWIANPPSLRRSAWPAQAERERRHSLERMRARLTQLEAAAEAAPAA